MRHRWSAAVAGLSCAWQVSCQPATEAHAMAKDGPERPPPAAEVAPAPAPAAQQADPRAERTPAPPLSAGQMIAIPAGPLRAGSPTGAPGRNPTTEVDAVEVKLGGFEIDRLPFPNDPEQAPRTGVTRNEAAELCEGAGKRLCDELEWERACTGPDADAFMTGATLDVEHCQQAPAACSSAEGAHAMGVGVREWTASEAPGGLDNPMRTAVIRGAEADSPARARRCAARDAATPDSSSRSLGFRCCRGEPQSVAYPALEADVAVTQRSGLDAAAQAEILRGVPGLAAHATGFEPFSRQDVDAALRRGGRSRGGISYWQILGADVLWSPVRGQQLLVLSGKVDSGALVAVLHVLEDGRYAHAASTVVTEDEASIALGFSEEHREQLIWTTCFDCAGEGGAIVWTDDARVEFTYR